MRLMITGGGTGGHAAPALALVEELHKRDPHLIVQWVGKHGAIEERISRNASIPFRPVAVAPWPRNRSPKRLWALLKLAWGTAQAYLYIRKFKPHIVLGMGGYVSLPLMLAAQRAGVRTALHEQNKRMGMANRLLATRADRILLSFPDTLGEFPHHRAIVVGNPVRAGFAHPPDKTQACERLGLDAKIPTILIAGGSQGARTLNDAARKAIPRFSHSEAQFLWMAGPAWATEARQAIAACEARVKVYSFIDDMVTACAAADLIVGRAGASTAAELAVMGKPSILVPLPHADNHQDDNAKAFEKAGASLRILDAECNGEHLTSAIRELLADPPRLERMGQAARKLARPHAAELAVDELLALIFSNSPPISTP